MITFLSNEKNDFQRAPGGNLQLFSTIDAIAQTARQYMQARRGEMFLAVQNGIPFDPVVWSGSPNIAQFEAASRARLLQVPNAVEVTAFSAELVDNILQYTATIRTTLGDATING